MAIYETEVIIAALKKYSPLYLRFIDDRLAVWEHHNNPSLDEELFQASKVAMNDSELKRTFISLSNGVEFVTLQLLTLKEGAFLTNLYEKSLALHLYIPPHSCHPPGCFSGLVTGMVLRIYRLCSLHCHIRGWLKDFYGHLFDRGYPHATIKSLFVKVVRRAEEHVSSSKEYILQRKTSSQKANNNLFLQLKYTSGDPSSKNTQKLWRELVLLSQDKPHLTFLGNHLGERLTVSRLVIAATADIPILEISFLTEIYATLRQLCCHLKKQGHLPYR